MQEEQNLGTVEEWVRTLGGSLSSLTGIALLIPGLATLLSGVLGVMLVLLGLYLFVTDTTGYCPIYRRLGWATRRVEGEQDGVLMGRWRRTKHGGGVHNGWKHRVLMVLYCLPMIAVVAWLVLRVGARDMKPEQWLLRKEKTIVKLPLSSAGRDRFCRSSLSRAGLFREALHTVGTGGRR